MDLLSLISVAFSIVYLLYWNARLPKVAFGEGLSERNSLIEIINRHGSPYALCPSCGKSSWVLPRELILHFHEGDYVPAWVFYPQGICAECCWHRFWPPLKRTLTILIVWYWACVATRLVVLHLYGVGVDSVMVWIGSIAVGALPFFLLELSLMTSRQRQDYENKMREGFLGTVAVGSWSSDLGKMKREARRRRGEDRRA